jgi:hypothetical protein
LYKDVLFKAVCICEAHFGKRTQGEGWGEKEGKRKKKEGK